MVLNRYTVAGAVEEAGTGDGIMCYCIKNDLKVESAIPNYTVVLNEN